MAKLILNGRVAQPEDMAALAEQNKTEYILTEYRRSWEETAGGASLLKVKVPVGLLLGDVLEALGIEDTQTILGENLAQELEAFQEAGWGACHD